MGGIFCVASGLVTARRLRSRGASPAATRRRGGVVGRFGTAVTPRGPWAPRGASAAGGDFAGGSLMAIGGRLAGARHLSGGGVSVAVVLESAVALDARSSWASVEVTGGGLSSLLSLGSRWHNLIWVAN